MRILLLGKLGDFFDLSLAEQGRGPDCPHAERPRGDDADTDRRREALRFLDPRFGRTPDALAGKLGNRDDRPFAARDLNRAITVKRGTQLFFSVLSGCSCPRSSECAGCSVDIACLYTSCTCPPRSRIRLN